VEPAPPASAPKKRRKQEPKVDDLPLFAPPKPKSAPYVPKPLQEERAAVGRARKGIGTAGRNGAAKVPRERVAWGSPRTWLPVIALAMLFGGAWLLLEASITAVDVPPEPDRSLPTVVIDAGHGGHDSGARNHGLMEKDLTLDTALRVERHLRERGFPVVMTRRDDRYLELFDRAHIANKIPRALFVSIHFNASSTGGGDGVETFYAQQKAAFSGDGWTLARLFNSQAEGPPLDQGAGFAQAVQASMVARLGVTDRGAKPRQLAVVRLTRCPAVLVEGGFLNNPVEARKLATAAYREELAIAVADGVAGYARQKQDEVTGQQVAHR
jgi:N-acetylmuramoyl-L-alanine amidase